MVVILTPHRFNGGWNPSYKGLLGPSSAAGWAKVFVSLYLFLVK